MEKPSLSEQRSKIKSLHKEIERLITEAALEVETIQSTCEHKYRILKAPFRSGTILDQEELRLCTMCGLQVSGWNPGFKHPGFGTNKRETMVSREELYKARSILIGRTCVGIG